MEPATKRRFPFFTYCGHGLGLLAPADDGVPVGLRLAVLAAAVGGQPQGGDGGAILGMAHLGVGSDAAQQFDSINRS